jgi:hypothetical protein
MQKHDYELKISEFINNNDLAETNIDPTKQYQKNMRNIISKCNMAIPKDKKWLLISLIPKAPQIKGFIKLHKTDNPIRPVINFQSAPAYKIARFLTSLFNNMFQLPYTFNVRNSAELIADLTMSI